MTRINRVEWDVAVTSDVEISSTVLQDEPGVKAACCLWLLLRFKEWWWQRRWGEGEGNVEDKRAQHVFRGALVRKDWR